ncbi:hypothetical protein HR086_39780 [Myxococcus sp. CA039A]|nr:hypothetical protein [Myxococcus sp. CA039A]
MVKRMMGPSAVNASTLARQVGVSQPTLSQWLRAANSGERQGRCRVRGVSRCASSPARPGRGSERGRDGRGLLASSCA